MEFTHSFIILFYILFVLIRSYSATALIYLFTKCESPSIGQGPTVRRVVTRSTIVVLGSCLSWRKVDFRWTGSMYKKR